MTDAGSDDRFDNLHRAVREFGRMEVEALCRRAIYQLQRIEASGIFSGDYIFKSIWDEFCHEIQEGPHELLENAWHSVILPCIQDVIAKIPNPTATLLTIYASWELDDDEHSELFDTVAIDAIGEVVKNRLQELAGSRSLEHLGPHRDYL